MKRDEVISTIKFYFDEIVEKYGESKFQTSTPYLIIEDGKCEDDSELIGEYCFIHNELIVYWENLPDVESIIRTLVHEYTHYLQSPSWFTRYYRMGHFYNTHPYELKALEVEETWKDFLKK